MLRRCSRTLRELARREWVGGLSGLPAALLLPLALPLTLAMLGGCQQPPAEGEPGGEVVSLPAKSHNVVIMLIDTLRADRLGVYGYEHPTSPNIDRLAAESVLFERAHAAAPWTLPSVTSLMLSQPLCEHGVVYDRQTLQPAARPLALRLNEFGYRTAALFVNPYAGKLSGLDLGFETSRLESRQNDGARVAEWLAESTGERPFFLYLHNTEPHNPPAAKRRFLDALGYRIDQQERQELASLIRRYRQLTRIDFVRGQVLGTTDNTVEQQRALARLDQLRPLHEQLYDAQVMAADERVGSVVETLRDHGLWRDTLFILLADHGEEMADHGGWQHDQSVYEELIHVPLLVKLPGGSHAGERVGARVSLLDVLPTVMAVLGRSDLAQNSRGRSLLALLGDGETTAEYSGMRVTSLRHNAKKYYRPWFEQRGDVNVVVVDEPWKGIYNAEVPSFELYDLSRDPGEQNDLSSRLRRRTRAMLRWAEEYRQSCLALSLNAPPSAVVEADQLRALKALGYVN